MPNERRVHRPVDDDVGDVHAERAELARGGLREHALRRHPARECGVPHATAARGGGACEDERAAPARRHPRAERVREVQRR